MPEEDASTQRGLKLTPRQLLQGGLAAGALAAGEWLPLHGWTLADGSASAVSSILTGDGGQ
jgi:hypothetical protein